MHQHLRLMDQAKKNPQADRIIHRLVKNKLIDMIKRVMKTELRWKLWWLLDHGCPIRDIELALREEGTNGTCSSISGLRQANRG